MDTLMKIGFIAMSGVRVQNKAGNAMDNAGI